MAPRLALAAALIGAAACSGCAAYLLPQGGARTLVDTEGANAALERIAPLRKGGSRLLYLYERGLILHDAGRYSESNQALEEADERYEDLYTKSLTREVLSLAISDELVPYRGATYESAFVHYYRILNYLELGAAEDAAVECRRLNRELQRCRDGKDSSYADDPFLQYVTGLVYGITGHAEDAEVSRRAARSSYGCLRERYGVEPPPDLGPPEDADSGARGAAPACLGADSGRGVVHLLLEYGVVPAKVERVAALPIYRDEIRTRPPPHELARGIAGRCGMAEEHGRELVEVLTIALPALEERPRAARAVVTAGVGPGGAGVTTTSAVLASDLAALSRRAFEQDYGRALMRAVTRTVAKCLAREAAREEREKEEKERKAEGKKSSGWGARIWSWSVDAFTVVTERADVRCWSTLPGQILVARLDLPAGRHALEVEVADAAGARLGVWRLDGVDVIAGRERIARFRLRGAGDAIGAWEASTPPLVARRTGIGLCQPVSSRAPDASDPGAGSR